MTMMPDVEPILAELPAPVAGVCAPVFRVLPPAEAMPSPVPRHPAGAEAVAAVGHAVAQPELVGAPALQAGLWLYVDELDRSHALSQGMPDATGAFWHGIMHRREGDFSNAGYWFQRAGQHPALDALPGHDPHAFVDAVAAADGLDSPALVAAQRAEWAALFAWCARQ